MAGGLFEEVGGTSLKTPVGSGWGRESGRALAGHLVRRGFVRVCAVVGRSSVPRDRPTTSWNECGKGGSLAGRGLTRIGWRPRLLLGRLLW